LKDEVYQKTRGQKSLLEYKLKTIENARKVKMDVILVPTLVKGFNNDQVGEIVKFAVKNNDVISGIAFQPVSFVGRYSQSHILEKRYTLADLAFDIERQTGYINALRDWFPISCTGTLSKLASALSGKPVFTLSLHPHCSQGTYLYIGPDGTVKPISEFIDMANFMREVVALSKEIKPSMFTVLSRIKVLSRVKKYFHEEKAPRGLTFEKMLQSWDGYQDKSKRRIYSNNGKGLEFGHIFVAGMHFMDAYNFSVERVMRCVIHYTDPRGHLYPFCAYNALPYRKKIENRFKLSPDRVKEKLIAEGRPKELEMIARKMGL